LAWKHWREAAGTYAQRNKGAVAAASLQDNTRARSQGPSVLAVVPFVRLRQQTQTDASGDGAKDTPRGCEMQQIQVSGNWPTNRLGTVLLSERSSAQWTRIEVGTLRMWQRSG
jgi:hypothetical protein